MGTTSKRSIDEFGAEVRERVDDLRSNVGKKLDDSKIEVSDQSNIHDEPGSEDRADLPHQIERVMAALPSTTWLTLAGAAVVSSIGLKLIGRHSLAAFVGVWTPTFLICGLYNKLTKVGAATALLSSRR